MTAFSLVYTLHVLSALVWVGGMFFAWMVLRPAAIKALEGPARLKLWVEVFQGFFRWVWVAVVLLPISGVGMIHLQYSGFESAPRYVQIMMGLYLVMTALFIRIQALLLPELRTAVGVQDWPVGAAVLGRIRRLVGINLMVGLVLVAMAAARPTFEALREQTRSHRSGLARDGKRQALTHISYKRCTVTAPAAPAGPG